MELVLRDEAFAIMGACFEVYKDKGCGFLESVYHECLEIEFSDRKIPYTSRHPLLLQYKGNPLKQTYIPDFVCFGKIIIEIKANKFLADEHRAQTINYLKATGLELGLLVNFGHYPKIEYQRFLNKR